MARITPTTQPKTDVMPPVPPPSPGPQEAGAREATRVENLAPPAFVSRPIGGNAAPPPMRGGSAGVIPSQAPKLAHQMGHVVASAVRPERAGAPVARKYRVLNGGYIVERGFRVAMPAGKVIEDTQYDIEALRTQGIVLDDLTPPPPPAPEPVVEDEPSDETTTV